MAEKTKEKEVVEEVLTTKIEIKKVDKVFSLEQWAKARSKQAHHLGGIKAWLKEKASHKYPMSVWDAMLSDY